MPYEHVLTDALSIRGMQALFAVAIPRSTSREMRLLLFDRWCNELQRRAFCVDIGWLPATGTAMTAANVPTSRVAEILLQITGETPVPAARHRKPQPREPGHTRPAPLLPHN